MPGLRLCKKTIRNTRSSYICSPEHPFTLRAESDRDAGKVDWPQNIIGTLCRGLDGGHNVPQVLIRTM